MISVSSQKREISFRFSAPDSSANLYALTWTCKFPNNNDTYYFAHCYPYTYSDLQVIHLFVVFF